MNNHWMALAIKNLSDDQLRALRDAVVHYLKHLDRHQSEAELEQARKDWDQKQRQLIRELRESVGNFASDAGWTDEEIEARYGDEDGKFHG